MLGYNGNDGGYKMVFYCLYMCICWYGCICGYGDSDMSCYDRWCFGFYGNLLLCSLCLMCRIG